MTKTYRDEIDALNDLRHHLKEMGEEARLAPAGNGWVLFAGKGDLHAVSYCDLGGGKSRFSIHEGPDFGDAEEAAFSIANFGDIDDEADQHEALMLIAKTHLGATGLNGDGALYRALEAAFKAGQGWAR